eukprot:2878296-Rhodomonas_salina.1
MFGGCYVFGGHKRVLTAVVTWWKGCAMSSCSIDEPQNQIALCGSDRAVMITGQYASSREKSIVTGVCACKETKEKAEIDVEGAAEEASGSEQAEIGEEHRKASTLEVESVSGRKIKA